MQEFSVRCATDITGFGLLGHALKMALASYITLKIRSAEVPILPGAFELADKGCIPGAAFRNQEFVEQGCRFPFFRGLYQENASVRRTDIGRPSHLH